MAGKGLILPRGGNHVVFQAREELRRRYLFPPDAEVPLEHEGYPRPGEALPPGI